MAHSNNRRRNGAVFSWAEQAAWSSNGQQWRQGHDVSAQSLDSTHFLNTEAPRNPQSMIQEFNEDLPHFPEPLSGDSDLSFDLAIGGSSSENHNLDDIIAATGPSSCGLSRSLSHASCHAIDEIESVTFSIEEDKYHTSFSDGIFNANSPASSSISYATLSGNPSVENSPVISNSPWPELHTHAHAASGSMLPNEATVLQVSAAHSNQSPSIGSSTLFAPLATPNPTPRQHFSALTAGLLSQNQLSPSPTAEYFEHWSAQLTEEAQPFSQPTWEAASSQRSLRSFDPSHLQPSFVIHPPEVSDVGMGQTDHFRARGVSMGSDMHHVDHLSTSFFTPQAPRAQSFSGLGIPTMAHTQTRTHLSVPSSGLARRPDGSGLQARSTRRRNASESNIAWNRPVTSLREQQSLSPMNLSGMFQKPSPTRASSLGVVTAPVPIASQPRRPAGGRAGRSASTSPIARLRPVRGRRSGPMNAASRTKAKETRNKKMVCIRCKHSKQACEKNNGSTSNSICSQCERHGSSNKWPGPCVKAHFEGIVLSGSCNYLSHRAINHLTLDCTRRIRKELPEGFPLDNVITTLERVQGCFDIGVYHDGQLVYVLDLNKCHAYLLSLRRQTRRADRSLRSFIDEEVVRIDPKSDEWESCMTQLAMSREDPLALLCKISNMPSRARYSYVFKTSHANLGRQEHFLDPEDPTEEDNIVLAAQLSRVICRKVEVKAYGHLQRALHKSDSLEDDEVLRLLKKLGDTLLMLRWRLSWWAVMLGDGSGSEDDEARAKCEERVRNLCWVLYFYYCSVRRKLEVWSNVDALRGVQMQYPDAEFEVWNDFPSIESEDEFEKWIKRGQDLVYATGLPRVLGLMGLPA